MAEPTAGRCNNSATGFCVAGGKGALVCARTVCPGLEGSELQCKTCSAAYTAHCQHCYREDR